LRGFVHSHRTPFDSVGPRGFSMKPRSPFGGMAPISAASIVRGPPEFGRASDPSRRPGVRHGRSVRAPRRSGDVDRD